MKTQFIILVIVLMVPVMASAQKTSKRTAPKAKITIVDEGSEKEISHFTFGKKHTIKVNLEGGVQNVDHKIFVTSRHAIVTSLGNNLYEVTPVTKDDLELIVDVQTYEDYQFYEKKVKVKGKKSKAKKVLSTYPPRKYMVAFETYDVN